MNDNDYIPFGPEWENHMRKLPKEFLINMLRPGAALTLTEKERKLIAFSLFSMGMKIGPASFECIEAIVQKTGIEDEFIFYAKDWIDFPQRNKNESNEQ